ncbi:lysyl-tRNA synthetase, class I [Rhodoblastus acidophilus]|uniref:Lysine--tRNA ligase n=1 Tax=Rhodoblastus acidophilus TaxID=1074 RepID=A0A212R537_RHOAC|nr:lysine--tRNA ligase [Rhodoblastus acidophilus]PPQ36516.1 lysine--tRNA ligase [Rhodoblastus acidophilus]RAI16334.1 lysine--tRNA ligase [Rhodoblastus acidophilus]SNB66978.1 lysyl-tRNA synthetase, class I [Rhodoblastus acidophilus]
MTDPASELAQFAKTSNAWPFEEAKKLVARVERTGQKQVLFETGYGPSGLPHIGTFGEVARTTMVRHAFETLTGGQIATRLLAFSDDLDGLRKVPDNIPNKELVAAHLGKPLTEVPDPFGKYPSFGEHNNARLRSFLDHFGFKYEFGSSTEYYTSGRFDATLLKMLARYDAVQKIMLPSLRAERASTYSPFLPIHPRTRIVMQVALDEVDVARGLIAWRDPDTGERFETPVTGGACKLQWKPDWAMRWCALGVDYEMAGKDLIDSVKLSGAIVRALDGAPPEGFNYELFLDENSQKISKSKGNGITIEQWLTYASPESLAFFMYWKPREAKKLYFDVIPRAVDEYLAFLDAYPRQDAKNRLGNAVWHIHSGEPPAPEFIAHEAGGKGTAISFAMLLNLAAVANSEDPAVLWGFVRRYAPAASPEKYPRLDKMIGYAVLYFRDFVKPKKVYRAADEVERAALEQLSDALAALPAEASAEDIQTLLYDIARPIPRYQNFSAKGATPERPGVSNDWFNMLYQVLLGEDRGPRFGSFAALYGLDNTRALIADALAGKFLKTDAA